MIFKRTIGFWKATMIGIGSLIGVAIFVLIGEATLKTGPAVIASYILALFASFLMALVYAELSTTYKQSGGGYNYVKQTIDGYWSFLTGWILITGNIVAIALSAIGFSEYIKIFLDFYDPTFGIIIAISTLYLLCLINYISATNAHKFEFYLTIFKVLILIIIGIAGLKSFQASNFTPFFKQGISPIFSSASLVYMSFFGFQAIATVNEEIKNPQKTIPRAILASLTGAGLIYLLLVVALVGSLHVISLENTAIALNMLAYHNLGRLGIILITITALFAILSSMNAIILATSRQIYAMGRDNFLPFYLSRIHKKFHTPHFAILTISIICTFLIMFDNIGSIAKLASLCYLIGLSIVSFSLIVSRYKHHLHFRVFKLPFSYLIPTLAILANSWIIYYSDLKTIAQTMIWLSLSTLLFYSKEHYIKGFSYLRLKLFSLLSFYRHHLNDDESYEEIN